MPAVSHEAGRKEPRMLGSGTGASWLMLVPLRGSKMVLGGVRGSWELEPTPASEVRSQCQVTEQPANRQEQVLSLLLSSSLPLIPLQLEPSGELSVKGEMHFSTPASASQSRGQSG